MVPHKKEVSMNPTKSKFNTTIYTARPTSNRHAARKVWDMAVAGKPDNPPLSIELYAGIWFVVRADRTEDKIYHNSSLSRKWKRKPAGATTPPVVRSTA